MKATCVDHIQRLTKREREVLCLLGAGHNAKEVADELDLSVKTVEFHRQRIYAKLGLATPADLARCVVEAGLVRGCPSKKWRTQ